MVPYLGLLGVTQQVRRWQAQVAACVVIGVAKMPLEVLRCVVDSLLRDHHQVQIT
jgi:hypothetical protein